MELLHEFKQNGYFTASLYHLLANKKFVDIQTEITPSEYVKEMKMGTEERLQSLHNIEVDNIVSNDKSRVVLSFTPRLLIFQNYKTNDKVVTKFSVKNISKAPTYLSMVFKESSYFVIKTVGGKLLSRLAPGISVTFSITFQPDKIEDYIHQVKFYTDVDEYVLPLIAIGPRPLIHLPDQVIIPAGPLKVENHSMIMVQNIGLVPVGLSFTTKSPFGVQPKSIFLNPNETIDVRIGFKTMNLGETKGILNVTLETGEIFRINVIGSTHLVSVELEKQTVRFLDTYNTMIRQQTLKINNRSDHLLTYACMKNDSVFNDFEDKVKLATMFYNFKDVESAKANKLIHYDVLSSDEHERVYTRIFYNEIQALVADKSLFFHSSHFSISPINGKIWPNKSSELTITFCPTEIGNFQVTTYLDIDGISNRIPLLMSGTSLPPSITLNLETLDMDRVYINKTYNYEIVAKNKGHINGTVLFKEVPSLFGSTISCNPKMRCLRPGEMDIFVISFCNKNQGPFFEEINFPIRDTDVVLKVYLKGIMVYPTLTFSLPRLDFGLVSLGVPKTLQLEVTNDSTVQVDSSVKIPSDGPEISSIVLRDYAVADKPKPQIPQWPKEFNIEPSKISVEPETSVVLKITLTPNLIRTNQTYLELEMDKSDSLPIVLAVTYEAKVTQIIPAPNIKLRFCYLDSPYKEVLSIKCNEFWGYFTLDEPEKTSSLVVDAAIKEGFLEPNSNLEIPIVVKTSEIGYQECDIRFNLFGLSKPVQVCHIEVTGVQPIVTTSPTSLHWGHIKLLTNNQKVLSLYNDSPVVINFKTTLMHKDDKLTINPSEGQIDPDGEVTLTFNLCLTDADTYLNKAIIQMEKVNDLIIPLSATGVGTSITVGEYKDRIELGKQFTRIPLNCKVIMENCGTRMHALEWSEYFKPPKTKQHVTGCFGLEPRELKLAPGEKLELTITGVSNKVITVKETWYLIGNVEGINKKELLLECPITVEFVDPKIEVSALTLNFRYDFGPYSEYYKLTDIVTIKNVSTLPLDLEISTKSPFAVIQKQSSYKIFPYEENLCNCICYESDINVSNIINEHGTNRSKIFIDYLTLAPVDVRKKSVLNFFEDINKIKEAFNLTYYVEERLDDQELMKLHVLFDTSKHTSLKSRIYSDFLKIKFKGHKNKDAIKLVGEVNHPNILILTPEVDFQSVLNNSIESKTIKIQNISPLLLCYKLKWKKYSITMDPELSLQKLADYKSTYSFKRHSETDLIGLKEILSPRTPAPSEIFKTERDSERNFNAPPICSDQDDIELEKKVMKRISPIVNLAIDSKCEWFNKLPRQEKHHSNNINEILQLVPHRGLLKPNDIQYVHVIFKPTNNVNIRAILECDVLGGPSEFISIHGQGSDMSYALNSKSINFKIRSFHECATEKFILSNTSQLSFQYNIYFNERSSESELCMTILNISPNEKYLKRNEEIEIVIEVRPDIMGYFKKTFLLEVGHLPFIPIDIFGWGVVPQVYLNLPRLEILKTPVELGYQAISTLTQAYLDVINETLTDTGTTGHLNTPLTEKYFEDHLFQDDWYTCSIWEKYPTIMDIELAVERVLVMKYIEQHPNVLSVYKTGPKKIPLPGFYTTPFLLDFGVVITGNTVQRAVDVINYGPISTTLKFAKGTSIPSWLKMKLSGKINPGEIGKLEITFSPNLNDFKELEQEVELSFNLEVPYGVSVPVHIKALCALPYLRSNVNVVNFGSVRCGDKIIHSIPLKNIGRPTCIWYASLKVKSQGFNPLTILTTSGKFGPGEGGWLNMSFKPTMEMEYEGLLVLTFHMNPNKLIIPVFGKCILPQVLVIGSNVVFPPTLPYAETSYIYFGLTNPCPFPIELIFAHNDTKWKEEEEIYQLLYNYYNEPEEMLVPVQAPGLGLPQEIINFYLKYKEAIKRQEEIELSKGVSQTRSTATAKKTRSPKTPAKTTQIKETSSQEQQRTDVEIAAEVMKNMKDQNLEPLRDAQSNEDNLVIEKCNARHEKGILIFVHGSPCEEMECKEIAYSTGKSLSITTVNIDSSIVEALCVSNCAAKFAILASINEFYEESLQKSITKSDLSDNEEYPEYKAEETDDEFDTLWKKLELFVFAKSVTTTRSNKKKKLSNSSLPTQPGSSTIFHFELLQELLTDFFMQPKFEKGFVVDTLTSIIIKSPPLVLTTVLKCKPAIWNIHLILCHSDFITWAQAYQEAQQAPEIDEKDILNLYDEDELDNIIESFEEMSDSEYEAADPALKQIYTTYGLEARRKKYFEKKGYRTESKTQDEKIRDRSKSTFVSEANESRKKNKKEDIKEKPTSDFLLMNTKYNNYVHAYENLINIANNWIVEECDVGQPLYSFNGQVIGAINKKAHTKSEKQVQASEASFAERGFPLTIIKCPCLQHKNAILKMFARSVTVQEALKEEEPYNILKSPVSRKVYSVLLPKTFPVLNIEETLLWIFLDEQPIKKCECNDMTDLYEGDDTNQDNVLNIISKWHCTCGKRVVSSQTSTNEIPLTSTDFTADGSKSDIISLPLNCIKSLLDLKSRIILEPGDLIRCKYAFSPQAEGHFRSKRFVEVCGWPNSRVDVNASGICDLPRLDSRPKKMFQSFIRHTTEDRIYKGTFLDDQKFFEFGPIFIGNARIYEEKSLITLKNTSLITTDIEIEFLEDISTFKVDKTNVRLQPGCKDLIWILAAPTEIGVHKCVLLFCIRDNPEIITLNITCTGVVPFVEILPESKTIDFGKHLLYRREHERFIVKNNSILPIKWKIRNAKDFAIDFIIDQQTGVVQREDNQVVPLTYIACRVGTISDKTLIIDIYDAEGRGTPMLTNMLHLSAECYDVLIDCVYKDPNKNSLDYGNVKINSTEVQEIYLLNRGKYSIYFKLKKVKTFPEPSLLRSLRAYPERGVIPPTLKPLTIEFECTPTTSMNLVNVPAYTCSLLDDSRNQVVVAKFPIYLTIASFYNTFTLFPKGELTFPIIPVGTGIIRDLILSNTSKSPFTYEIVLPKKYEVDSDVTLVAKAKDTRLKNPPLKCGNFLIFTDDNLLAPGTNRTLKIQFTASAAETFEETIYFVVSDTCPEEAKGVPFKLVGTGSIPTLDFWNIETTFREHLIVKKISEYKLPESCAHCVFVEDSVTLHFFCVTINTNHAARIDLFNNGIVACALNMKLHYQSNCNQEIFSLDRYQTYIEPLVHKNLVINFNPKELVEYRAVLEIRLKLLDNQEQIFKICLIGEGVIPRVNLIYPHFVRPGLALLHFLPTCLGSVSCKEIRIKNVSCVKTLITADVLYNFKEERPIFWITMSPNAQSENNQGNLNLSIQKVLEPEDIGLFYLHFNPIKRGKMTCDVEFRIYDNPFEQFTVLCDAEAFMEDIILVGLEMLPMDIDLDTYKTSVEGTVSSISLSDNKKKSRSASFDKKKLKISEQKRSKRTLRPVSKYSDTDTPSAYSIEHNLLKYILDFGGCELFSMKKRALLMVNNSEKVYKFKWEEVECIVVKPSVGYISPGEEKDLEILFYSPQPVVINKELLFLHTVAISDEFFTMDIKGASWDSRQIITLFDEDKDANVNERKEAQIDDQNNPSSDVFFDLINLAIVYSATTEYTKYHCSLSEEFQFEDTFIYQTRNIEFKLENVGKVPLKITWSFIIDEEFPIKINKCNDTDNSIANNFHSAENFGRQEDTGEAGASKETLFNECSDRESVDTWFEVDLPFKIEPEKDCLKPKEVRIFKISFSPLEAFMYNVRLRSIIDNLDPYDQVISSKIQAKSLIPYVHFDIEESDYLTSGRRKNTEMTLPQHTTVLEFNVLGWGCYKKTFNIINPTKEGYEFIFEMIVSDNPELVPVHCDMLKGFVEGGTSTEVTFTFAPTVHGVYESQWKFIIPSHALELSLLVVGTVREPAVNFVPTILVIRNSLVGFTTRSTVLLKNNESESLNFEFKGTSLLYEKGETPVLVEPEKGVLKARQETPIYVTYTPIEDGPLSFKIFCNISYLSKPLTLCVNALSYCISPTVLYYFIGNEYELKSGVATDIHLEQTASTYERTIPFTIRNDGSATFCFDWRYDTSSIKKYLQLNVKPSSGHVTPASKTECVLHFTLKQVPVQNFPVTLSISDGPEYNIFLHAKIEKPLYHFSCMEYNFGKCIVHAPDSTYKKIIVFENEDMIPITLELNFTTLPELLVQCSKDKKSIKPKQRTNIAIYFRPKQIKEYKFYLEFWVNSLCKEIITIEGEGIPLLFDLYEGCQKSYDLGPVKISEKSTCQIEVMNHSKVPITASFIFRYMRSALEDNTNSEQTSVCLSPTTTKPQENEPSRLLMLQQYRDSKLPDLTAQDIQNVLSSIRVVPKKCTIKPHRKVPLKIHFNPVQMVKALNVQLNMKVLHVEKPLVRLIGSATGMSLCLSPNALQFGSMRKRGCKILKVMLLNKGDFGASFFWEPLPSKEFTISPMKGNIAAQSAFTFTVTFQPLENNPFIKVWARCNIENYHTLELALYGACMEIANVQNKTIHMECPVREIKTEVVVVTNPSDDMWLIVSEDSGGPFDTLKEFHISPNSTFDIPIHFKPMIMGKYESRVLFFPLGQSSLLITLIGSALPPNPNAVISIAVPAKEFHTEELLVHNITENLESYVVSTELVKVIPDKFQGYYEIKCPDAIKVWGEAAATCRWTFVCYEECQMMIKVVFINEETLEYQFYNIEINVTASKIVDTLTFVCRARESSMKELVIRNPLSTEADFFIRCDRLTCPESLRILGNSEATLSMVYSPLVVGETQDYLEVKNNLIGTLYYVVIFKCLPANEKNLEFTTTLGSLIPLRLRVQNRTNAQAEFKTSLSHPSIIAESKYVLGPQEKGKFQAWFEPTELGVQFCKVSFNSPDAGEFIFNIRGVAEEPKPQGPFEIKAGGSRTITFKNVFENTQTFKINIDREDFSVKTTYETIKSKKDAKVTVYLSDKPADGMATLPTGCLTITPSEPATPKVQWMYFLQGVL